MKTFRMNSEKEKKRKIQRREKPNPRSIRMSKKRKGRTANQRKEEKNPNPNHRANRPFAGAGEEVPSGGSCSPGSVKGAPRPGHSTAACSPVGEHARRRGGRRRRRGSLLTPARCRLGGRRSAEEERRESGERGERKGGVK